MRIAKSFEKELSDISSCFECYKHYIFAFIQERAKQRKKYLKVARKQKKLEKTLEEKRRIREQLIDEGRRNQERLEKQKEKLMTMQLQSMVKEKGIMKIPFNKLKRDKKTRLYEVDESDPKAYEKKVRIAMMDHPGMMTRGGGGFQNSYKREFLEKWYANPDTAAHRASRMEKLRKEKNRLLK